MRREWKTYYRRYGVYLSLSGTTNNASLSRLFLEVIRSTPASNGDIKNV